MGTESHKYDLPLLSNSEEIQVKHFVLDMSCDIVNHKLRGDIYLILQQNSLGHRFNIAHEVHIKSSHIKTVEEILKAGENNTSFCMVLDSKDLIYNLVEEVEHIDELVENGNLFSKQPQELIKLLQSSSKRKLEFENEEWSLKIWKPGICQANLFPKIIKISYETIKAGTSLRWATDQDGNVCMYSAAMWVNNRSLFPCQEYGCFSTWHARLTVPDSYSVLMSGDNEAIIEINQDGEMQYFYHCFMPLPSFTLAIAIGKWGFYKPKQQVEDPISDIVCHHDPLCDISFSNTTTLPWRIWAPPSILQQAIDEFSSYLDPCTKVIQELLGPSPFTRLDIVIYPGCSQDMAMSNPNLIFLSQSMLCGDKTLCIKLAHEISHYWFGLLIGAKDWTEEWLSEGFATFVEDIIHARVMKWSSTELEERSELRALLRYNSLIAEMENIPEDIQSLRPNGDVNSDETDMVHYIKNGMNPYKQFSQVHYLKGYFLLRHLSEVIGVQEFSKVFKDYVIKFHGHMVLSKDFINLVLNKYPQIIEKGITEDSLYEKWLDTVGMPKDLSSFQPKVSNSLYQVVLEEVTKWKRYNSFSKSRRKSKTRKVELNFKELEVEQRVLALEELLKEKKLTNSTLSKIKQTYNLKTPSNPDVRHRWCELVIKHKCSIYYDDVRWFLIHDQAMGVYLYGELIISRCKKQRLVAEESYKLTSDEMDGGTRNTVRMMIYGT